MPNPGVSSASSGPHPSRARVLAWTAAIVVAVLAPAPSAADPPTNAAPGNAPPVVVAAPRDFPALAFGALLNVSAILFGVFGFLYSVYALYAAAVTTANPIRPPICIILRSLCRGLAVLFVATSVLEAYALVLMLPLTGWEWGLATGLGLVLVAITGVSVWMAFWLME